MVNEYEKAAARIDQGQGPWPAEDWTVLAALIDQAVGSLCGLTMNYRCEDCGFEWEVYLALGLEGPGALKQAGLALPVPFVISCPAWRAPEGEEVNPELTNLRPCEGSMTHVRWSDDRLLAPPEIPPDDAPRFVLPDSSAGESPPCGRLEIPGPALVRARRSWGAS
jgi:hypothetical protein